MPLQPPITEPELRDWLFDAGLAVDDATAARLLVRLQPMRARLRGATLAQLESALRGHAMAAGWQPSRDAMAGGPPSTAAASPAGRAADRARPLGATRDDGPTLAGTLAGRLRSLMAAVVAGGFGVISMWGGVTTFTVLLFGAAIVLILAALTGEGLAGGRIGVVSVLTALLMAYAGVALLRFTLEQYRVSRELTDPGNDITIFVVLAALGVALVVAPAAMVVRGARK